MEEIPLGIDLGTTNSVAAYFVDSRAEVLVDREGNRLTPSFVFFDDKGNPIVGQHAQSMSKLKPEYGIYETKRLIGRKFGDPNTEKSLKYFAFKVDKDEKEDPYVLIEQTERVIKKYPEEISAYVLKKIKDDIEDKLSKSVDKVVITVPAYFNEQQREATIKAANLAGFTVLQLLNEPTATALKFLHDKSCYSSGDNFLVFDLGGGTFDIVILKKSDDGIDVVGVNGDTALGGHDIDNLIIDYTCKILKERYNYSPMDNRRQLKRLKTECEEAKKRLSIPDLSETPIILECFVPNHDSVEIILTKNDLEAMIDEVVKTMISLVDYSLKDCNLTKSDIKEIILAGGSSRIPKIQAELSSYFDGKVLCKFENPDECIAEGAALQAAILLNKTGDLNKIKIKDVIPLSIGLSLRFDEMSVVIKRNTPIPCTVTQEYQTINNKQESALIQVYEGERINCKHNRFLGDFRITNLTPKPPKECKIKIIFHVNKNGILKVTAKEKYKNNKKHLKIDYARSSRNDEQLKNTLKDSEENKEEDKKFMDFVGRAGYLCDYCIDVMYHLDELNLRENYEDLYFMCSLLLLTVRSTSSVSLEFIEESIKNLKEKRQDVMTKFQFDGEP